MTLTAPTARILPGRQTKPAHRRETLVAAHDVRKSFRAGNKHIEILHGISLAVEAGEVCAVMGPSGSGKSTLLYCLAGLEAVTGGSVHLLEHPITEYSRQHLASLRRKDLGFVFQSYNLVPTLTGMQNVELPFRLRRERVSRSQLMSILDRLNVRHLHDQLPATMSGGEQQRMAIARMIAQQPRIVFADEPTGALDTGSQGVVLQELCDLGHAQESCVLVVTHDPSVASVCDRVLFLRDGWLVDQLVRPSTELVTETMAGLTRAQERNVR